MFTEFKCANCDYAKTEELSAAEVAFARRTGSKKLIAVWACPKCKSDNSTEILIPE